jgi:hypothetical protein
MSYNNHQYHQNTPNVNNFKEEQRPQGPPPEQRSNVFNPYSAPPPQQLQQNYDYGSNYRQSQLPPQQYQGNNRGPPTAASLENAKYKFLPYGQPISPAPQQQAYRYNNQYRFYPPQGQGSAVPFVNQNVQNQSFNYSGYGQGQIHQEQPGGGGSGYFREQSTPYSSNYNSMPVVNTQFPPPMPVPLPVPAPLPVPPPSIPSIQPKSTTTSGHSRSAERKNKDKEPSSSSSSSSSNSSSRKSEKRKEQKELKKEEQEWPKQSEPVSEPKEIKTKKPVPIMVNLEL